MKNNGLIITSIILLSIVVIFLIVFLVMALTGNMKFQGIRFGINSKSTNIIYDKKFEIEDIQNIKVKQDAGDIIVKETSNDYIQVVLYGDDEKDAQVNLNEGELNVDFTHKRFNFISFGQTKNDIIIYVPSNYLGKLKIDNNFGNCEIENLENATIDIDSSAGDIKIGKVNEATVKCSCGNIDISEIKNKCYIKSDCGNVNIDKVSIKESSTIISNLGNVEINNTNDIYIEANVDLGKVNVNNNNRSSDITLKISSDCGNITVNN